MRALVIALSCVAGTATADPPRADEASGIAVAAPEDSHPVANALLFAPREVVVLVLSAPRYAAEGIDAYMAARSPNIYARDTHSKWRAGGEVAWEPVLGPSLALRLGYEVAPGVAIDAFGGALGPLGQSGGAALSLGPFGGVAPRLEYDAGRDLARVVSGMRYHERGQAVTLTAPARFGAFVVEPRAGLDSTRPSIGVREHAATVELGAGIDTRRPSAPWVDAAEPSHGTLVRAAAAYLRGTADGDFATARYTVEAKQLFDLFHGDRVLTIAAWGQTLSSSDVPFDRLPALGGADRMRAFARDELRGRTAAFADLEYAWPLGNSSRAFVFVESGEVAPSVSALSWASLHAGYGGGVRFTSGASTWLRLQLAGASTGDVGFFVMLGAL